MSSRDRFAGKSDGNQPVDTGVQPLAVQCLPIGVGRDEVFDLHLFEFTRTEDEIARRDLIAKGFADLSDAEGNFYSAGIDRVFIIRNDALSGFGP